MDFLEKLANAAKEANVKMDEKQAKMRSLVPHFETEEAALAYAQRLTQLKPGDRIKVFNADNTGFMDAVFVHMDDGDNSDCAKCIFYDASEGVLASASVSLVSLRLD